MSDSTAATPAAPTPLGYAPPIVGPVPSGSRAAGVALLIAASVLWSLSGVVVKVVKIDPIAFAFWRSAAAAAVMLLLLPLGRGKLPPVKWLLAGASLYTLVVTCTGTMFAMEVAAAGIAIMVGGSWKPGNWLGPFCGLLSGAAFGALILVLEKIDRAAGGANPFAIVLCNNAGAALMLLPICLGRDVLVIRPWQLGLVAATGAIQLAIPYVLFQLALRRVRPVDASLLILLEPVLNPVWVALATSERPDVFTVAGGIAILVAMVVEAVKPANPAPDS